MHQLDVLWPYDEDEVMAADHNGRPAAAAAPNAPPPSTLAAQLVENISASTKSTRSDENAELKKLFAVIEKVKNKPELLETAEQRTDHNHMLIYVYARVVLEGIKLDDPFADRNHMRNEALKAINFLKVTIEETPNVLNHTTDGKQFVFRGEEPLWIWVFPKILRLLGHSRCLELMGDFEGFFQFVILVVIRTGSMWKLLPSMLLYLRETSRGEFRTSVHFQGQTTNSRSSYKSLAKYGTKFNWKRRFCKHDIAFGWYTGALVRKAWHPLCPTDHIYRPTCLSVHTSSNDVDLGLGAPLNLQNSESRVKTNIVSAGPVAA